MRYLHHINYGIDFAVKWMLITLMMVIPIVMLMQVIIRYIFNFPLSWAEELVRICFVWVVFMSACAALRRKEIVAVGFLMERIRGKFALLLGTFGKLCVLAFFAFIIYSGSDMTTFVLKRGSITPAVGLPVWLTYLPIPLGFVFMAFQYILTMINDLKGWKKRDTDMTCCSTGRL